MTRMVRKQIYIEQRQNLALKERAKLSGLSEAELIRQGIDTVIRGDTSFKPDMEAWGKVMKFIKERAERLPAGKGAYKFNRAEIYDERMDELERRRNRR